MCAKLSLQSFIMHKIISSLGYSNIKIKGRWRLYLGATEVHIDDEPLSEGRFDDEWPAGGGPTSYVKEVTVRTVDGRVTLRISCIAFSDEEGFILNVTGIPSDVFENLQELEMLLKMARHELLAHFSFPSIKTTPYFRQLMGDELLFNRNFNSGEHNVSHS